MFFGPCSVMNKGRRRRIRRKRDGIWGGMVVGGWGERYASQKKKEEGEERDPPQRTNHEAASYHTHNAHAMQRRRSCETALICPKGPHMAPPFPPPLLLFFI